MHPISTQTRILHRESVVADLHADTPSLMKLGYDIHARHSPPLPGAALGFHVDVPRMVEGGQTLQVFGLVTVPIRTARPFRSALAQLRSLRQAALSAPERLWFVTEASQVLQAKAEGAVVAMAGLEGVHALEGSLENLGVLARNGLRLCGLAHFTRNEACPPAFGVGASAEEGLTPFGAQVVASCNDLGVIVDLAHVGRRAFLDATRLSTAPVVVSHTGLASVRPMWRNIDDEQVRAVADTGGCVGIIYSRQFLGGRGIDALVDHIFACWTVGGEDCPALGSDFDGLIVPVQGLGDPTMLWDLTQALLDRGMPERVVAKVLGGNVLRVLESVPQTAFPTEDAVWSGISRSGASAPERPEAAW